MQNQLKKPAKKDLLIENSKYSSGDIVNLRLNKFKLKESSYLSLPLL